MKRNEVLHRIRSLLALSTALVCVGYDAAAAPTRSVLGTIQVGGPDGWDYTTIDPVNHTLYIAHGSAVASVDMRARTAKAHLADAQGAHIAVPFAGGSKLLITHGKANQVTLNDAVSGAVEATIPTDSKPDAAVVEPTTGRAFVMANGGGTVDVVDLNSKSILARIAVGGAPEAAAFDGEGLVFTHLEDHNAIVVIDAKSMLVKATYTLQGCEDPSGIAIIPGKGLVLSACANQIARITDAKSGAEVASLPIGKHPDSAFWDDARHLGYIPCGDGTLTVISLKGDAAFVAEVVTTQAGARTGAVDPSSGLVYEPVTDFVAPTKPGARPGIVPGSLRVLVIGPAHD